MHRHGLAKAHFEQLFKCTPWKCSIKQNTCEWHLYFQLLSDHFLTPLDDALVRQMLNHETTCDETIVLFLCHIILAAKDGHLCIKVETNSLSPSVNQLWKREEGDFLDENQVRVLTDAIIQGSKSLTSEICTTVYDSDCQLYTVLCHYKNRFYLQRYWILETKFLHFLGVFLSASCEIELNLKAIERHLKQFVEQQKLLDVQARAVKNACAHSLTLITGGPGTGKTYTAAYLITLFWNQLSLEQQSTCEIVLAAPTGKAAANLQKSLSRLSTTIEGFPPLQAKTLHHLLEIKSSPSQQQPVRLTADLILVDESSMIDIKLMARLFESIKPGSRLILLGDEHQLPSVEAGNVFADLIEICKNQPNLGIGHVALKQCLRAEIASLIDFAHAINTNHVPKVLELMNDETQCAIQYLNFSSAKIDVQQALVNYSFNLFPKAVVSIENPLELLDIFQKIRLLSPFRKGRFGFETLNQLIAEKINRHLPKRGYAIVPIIITANDYRQNLFNGETGVMVRALSECDNKYSAIAYFPSQESGGYREYQVALLPKYEYAYCLSVHKSQGSEFDHVVLALSEGAELFGRQVFYTAVTRAKKKIEIFGTETTISKTIQQKQMRLSSVCERFC